MTDRQKCEFVPKLSVSWQADDDTLLYVTAAKGFRAGIPTVDIDVDRDDRHRDIAIAVSPKNGGGPWCSRSGNIMPALATHFLRGHAQLLQVDVDEDATLLDQAVAQRVIAARDAEVIALTRLG